MSAIVWPFLIYWLVLFVTCYIVTEMGQDLFYGEVASKVGLRVGAGTLILAALATWLRPTFETIFTSDIAWTLLQAVVWFLVFMWIFEFHPWHALGFSLVVMILVPGLATMGVDSLTKPSRTLPPVQSPTNSLPIRKSLNATAPPAAPK
ncbi:MAG: hypothetical protein NVSMB9_33640 [Isosphaeraceae bacterium]